MNRNFEILEMGDWETEKSVTETPISQSPNLKISQYSQPSPEREATKGNNIIPDNRVNNDCPDELTPPLQETAAIDSAAAFQEAIIIDTLQHIDSCIAVIAKKKLTHQHPVHIGLVTGIEWSNISGNPAGKAGVVYGLMIQYRLSARWSLETGCMLSTKQYRSQDVYYHRSLVLRVEPKMVDADCRVIDIPLNIRFDVMHKKEGRLYTGAGLSSYLMQQEDYVYYFDNGGTWNLVPERYYNKKRHYAAVANFMAGYEYLHRRFSFLFTPYLKVPLEDLGMARVQPVSKGLLFTLRYLW